MINSPRSLAHKEVGHKEKRNQGEPGATREGRQNYVNDGNPSTAGEPDADAATAATATAVL